MTNDPSSPH